jgi:CHAT domain-containing protein
MLIHIRSLFHRPSPALRHIALLYALWATLDCGLVRAEALPEPKVPPSPPLNWVVADNVFSWAGRDTQLAQLNEQMLKVLAGNAKWELYLIERQAGFLRQSGDLESARLAYDRLIALITKTCRIKHSPDRLCAKCLARSVEARMCQVDILEKQKRYPEALTTGHALLAQARAELGPKHNVTMRILEPLARAMSESGQIDEAGANFKASLDFNLETHGANSWQVAISWNNYATFLLQTGQTKAAATAFLEAGRVYDVNPYDIDAFSSWALKRNFTRLAIDQADQVAALTAAQGVFAYELEMIQNLFAGSSEEARLQIAARIEPVRWFATIGAARQVAQSSLQTKGITLDYLLLAAQASANTSELMQFAESLLTETDSRKFFKPSTLPKSVLNSKLPTTRPVLFDKTPEDLACMLPARSAAVDFVRYRHYLGRFQDELRYGAVVIPAATNPEATTTAMRWVPLGPAAEIDRSINTLAGDIGDPLQAGLVAVRLRALYDRVWKPVAAALGEPVETVFICPDGDLNFLPFGVLLDEHQNFIADRQLLIQVATLRDLFDDSRRSIVEQNSDWSVFAAPEFDQTSDGKQGLSVANFRDVDARDLAGMKLAALPGTRTEAEGLGALAKAGAFTPNLFLGADANEAAVRRVKHPQIVHFATHGFFLPASPENALVNPMDRSGLALTGAQTTLTALANRLPVPPSADDGILTAAEVARLDLHGTWIAALSACDTGRGDTRDGQGVLGLRRGFRAAGVENLLLTLWRIPDRETAGFMTGFYKQAIELKSPAMAFALTQREWLRRVRAEQGVAAAVSVAGGFVINTSGLPPVKR